MKQMKTLQLSYHSFPSKWNKKGVYFAIKQTCVKKQPPPIYKNIYLIGKEEDEERKVR